MQPRGFDCTSCGQDIRVTKANIPPEPAVQHDIEQQPQKKSPAVTEEPSDPWMRAYWASCIAMGLAYSGLDSLFNLVFGALLGAFSGLLIFGLSSMIWELGSGLGRKKTVIPVIGICINVLLAAWFLASPERGGGSCIDSGRYSEYSSCD